MSQSHSFTDRQNSHELFLSISFTKRGEATKALRMTYEYAACACADFDEEQAEESGDQGEGQGHSVTWRRRAISLCDVTWEPICILKFLSQVG